MKVFIRGASLALSLTMVVGYAAAQSPAFAPNEIVVKFKGATASVKNSQATVANAAIGATTKRTITPLGTYRIKVPAGMSVADAVFYYSGLSTVQYAEANYKREAYYTPNDTMFAQQYGPNLTKCKEAWDLIKGSPSIIIAIVDSGIDKNHEDLKNKLVTGYDFSDDDGDPDWSDSGGAGSHGVHVAGIAAAETNNAKGVAGTGFNCKIMPLKIFPNSFAENSAAALVYAADHGAKVINMSYGGPNESQVEKDAVNYAWGKGVVLVGAAGNDGTTNKGFPGGFENVIAVGATNAQDKRALWSTFGTDWVDVGAPGEDILSTVPGRFTRTSRVHPWLVP